MASTSNTYLNYYHNLYFRQNFFLEEICYCVGGNGIKIVVNGYANAFLASAHAERAAKVYFILYLVLCNKLLELFYYLAGAFDMAGAADTYSYFYHCCNPLIIIIFCLFFIEISVFLHNNTESPILPFNYNMKTRLCQDDTFAKAKNRAYPPCLFGHGSDMLFFT